MNGVQNEPKEITESTGRVFDYVLIRRRSLQRKFAICGVEYTWSHGKESWEGAMKSLQVSLLLLLSLGIPKQTDPQESQKGLLLEVILTTYDVSRTETLVYLRVFPDGSAEAHPMREVDFRTLVLKKAQISSSDLAILRELLSSPMVQHLDPEYNRYWGNKDFGHAWHVTIAQGDKKKAIVLENFEPFLARTKKKPYPVEIEKLGCLVWDLRTKVTGEPLERNYVGGTGGCRELGY